MNTYEGLFIFPELQNDEETETAKAHVLSEIERQGGNVLGVLKLGRREFSRPMEKQRSGVYVRVVFEIDGAKVASIGARLRLSDDVFRFQITRGDEKSLSWVKDPAAERSAVAQVEATV